MITHTATDSFLAALLSAEMDFSPDSPMQYKIALYDDTAELDETVTAYTATGEVVGTGYTAGGQDLTISVFPTVDAGKAYISFANPSWAGADLTARGALIYATTTGNPSVAVISFGENKSVSGGTFIVNMPPANADTAIIRIA